MYSSFLKLIDLFELSHLILDTTPSYSQFVSQYPAAQENNMMRARDLQLVIDYNYQLYYVPTVYYKYNYYRNVTNCNGLQLQITINGLHGNILHKQFFLLMYSLLLNLFNSFELSQFDPSRYSQLLPVRQSISCCTGEQQHDSANGQRCRYSWIT